MTKKEKSHLTAIYESNIRLCCSHFVAKDFPVARAIFYTTSQTMYVLGDFEMYGEQLNPIFKSYDIDRKTFVDYMQGARYL